VFYKKQRVKRRRTMLEFIVNWAVAVLGRLGYFGVGFLMALESACIPIPSEAILPFGGYLASPANTGNRLNLYWVIIVGTVGGTLGSIICYYIGALGGRPLVEKYADKLRLKKSHIEMSDRYFQKYGEKIAFYSRLLPIVRTFISLPAGFAHVHFGKFVIYTLLGSIPWTIMLIYAGMLLGENWQVLHEFGQTASIFVAISLILIAVYYYRRNRT
jgi:membrane protein DedA with SNARE-associated domain